jgi:hypothetical protein
MLHDTFGIAPVVRRIGDHLQESGVERALGQVAHYGPRLLRNENLADLQMYSVALRNRYKRLGTRLCPGARPYFTPTHSRSQQQSSSALSL